MSEYIITVHDEPDLDDCYRLVKPAQEIVRCRDCEFFEQDDVADGCTQFDFSIEYMERGYCAWGERRSE